MINEIMTFVRSLAAWGENVPSSFHPKVKANANEKAKAFLITFDQNGVPNISDFDDYSKLFFYMENNQNCAFSLKVDKASTLVAKLTKFINKHKELSQKFKIKALDTLVNRLNKVNFNDLVNLILPKIDKKGVYISFDHDELFDNIQTNSFFVELSNNLKREDAAAAANCEGEDFFGNNSSGSGKVFNPVKTDFGLISCYNKNKDNPAFQKYGLNSTNACVIGNETRQKISDTLVYLLNKRNETNNDQAGFFYRFNDYFIFTTIFPKNDFVECQEFEDWQSKIKDINQAIHNKNQANFNVDGQILIVEIPGKGAVNVVSSMSYPLSETSDRIDDWQNGLFNGSLEFTAFENRIYQAKMPSFSLIVKMLNKTWNRTWSNHTISKLINIKDVYSFFYNDRAAISRLTKSYAKIAKSIVCNKIYKGQYSHDINYLISLGNLILHKNNIKYEDQMQNWAYSLGRLLRIADYVYRRSYLERNIPVPKTLAGEECILSVLKNPQSGYAKFVKRFAKHLRSAQNINEFKEISNRLIGINIPTKCSDLDIIQIQQGYTDSRSFENAK